MLKVKKTKNIEFERKFEGGNLAISKLTAGTANKKEIIHVKTSMNFILFLCVLALAIGARMLIALSAAIICEINSLRNKFGNKFSGQVEKIDCNLYLNCHM